MQKSLDFGAESIFRIFGTLPYFLRNFREKRNIFFVSVKSVKEALETILAENSEAKVYMMPDKERSSNSVVR
ncbi:MAG: hypothetical protein PHW84_11505 [Methanosarcina sp.]|nr:hypothetical protein [Methanosarcina sp.]